jgi:outer membrane receptor protein involved in Fe transport
MDAARGLAFVAHANNLANRQVWLPDWKDLPTDSIFANRGRTVYFGIEVSFKKD